MRRSETKRRPAAKKKNNVGAVSARTQRGTRRNTAGVAKAEAKGPASRPRGTSVRRNSGTGTSGRPPKANNPIPIREVLQAPAESCANCGGDLRGTQKALFVEEEVGRVFCAEDCITAYFSADIERLEKEYHKLRSQDDLPANERKKLEHLRWVTLQDPDEVWRERTLSGDQRYTLISEFAPKGQPTWCICLCLFLRGEPSFLYLALVTIDPEMVDHYRRGDQVEWKSLKKAPKSDLRGSTEAVERGGSSGGVHVRGGADPSVEQGGAPSDGTAMLAEPFTEEETQRAQISLTRREDDIPVGDFGQFSHHLEGTLENPDEVWSIEVGQADQSHHIYHFMRRIQNAGKGLWYVIIAKDTPDAEDQLEILDAFPTRDPNLVEQFRRGSREVGESGSPTQVSRSLH